MGSLVGREVVARVKGDIQVCSVAVRSAKLCVVVGPTEEIMAATFIALVPPDPKRERDGYLCDANRTTPACGGLGACETLWAGSYVTTRTDGIMTVSVGESLC